jgi:4-amino-4-deoxy-L-arabinose transferase-like glycosyltransferase
MTFTATQVRPSRIRPSRARRSAFATALAAVPLLVILAVQTALDARVLHVSPITGDEGTYIYAGHQLIKELTRGGGSPYYETYLSGAPVLYPVLAALLDHVGGLFLVREASVACMLGTTALLAVVTRRMFGYWPAVTATALFTALGLTRGLGVLATYDAPSLLLLALAAYCAVRAGTGRAGWLISVPLVLLAANAVKYATVLFDPVVIGLAALQLRGSGWRPIALRAIALGSATAVLLVTAVALAGSSYLQGISYTTLGRCSGACGLAYGWKVEAPRQILGYSWSQIGLVVVLGFVAVAVALAVDRSSSPFVLLALLAVAGTLVTIENMRLHSATALSKHDDFGAWFTCIAAGYALARVAELTRRNWIKVPVLLVALVIVMMTGFRYLNYATQADSASVTSEAATAQLAPYLRLAGGRFLLGGLADMQIIYDARLPIAWWQFNDDNYIKYPVPGRGGNYSYSTPGLTCTSLAPGCVYLTGPAGYAAAIRAHAFTVISMLGQHDTAQDATIMADIRSTPGYRLLTTAGGAPTYVLSAPSIPSQRLPDGS